MVGIHFADHTVVIVRIHHNGHIFMVFCSRTHHSRPADIDVFHRISQRAIWVSYRLGERIEVHHHHIDWLNAVGIHHRVILAATA
ncbi:Uncharacterised protein [Vibrio cholerae]|nr:Uncharacterised protein [Vibrio cholerae]CSA61906.1 Uncharacterised protein [Vibrio cholerae]CSB11674.1 Uncharacterised protein [Vibrio cholerae]CSB17229.1 Uncharacterised protein [Vibrio cholerae]CSB73543.1 Uncharacterised protein [Vibrio cholerae]